MTLEQLCARHCLQVVTAHRWSKKAACEELDIDHRTLNRYLRIAGVERKPEAGERCVDPVAVLQEAHGVQ